MPATKMLLLGATGPAGIVTLRKALDSGMEVTVYARTPSKVPSDLSAHKNLTVVQGTLEDTSSLSRVVKGQTVVVSLLGPSSPVFSHQASYLTDFYRRLIDIMRKEGVRRIFIMGTVSIVDPKDSFSILRWLLATLVWAVLHRVWKDIVSIPEMLHTDATDMNWTVFRLGNLHNKEYDGKKEVFEGYVGRPGWRASMSRAEIAEWLIREAGKEAGDERWVKECPAISTMG